MSGGIRGARYGRERPHWMTVYAPDVASLLNT